MDQVCRPLKEGGLDVFKFRWWDTALLFKLVWDIATSKKCLRIQENFPQRADVWNVTSNKGASWICKELLVMRDCLIAQVEYWHNNLRWKPTPGGGCTVHSGYMVMKGG
ncbi:hypothetical protein Drorol1_Dr00011905 [Drosera rotundifolia]